MNIAPFLTAKPLAVLLLPTLLLSACSGSNDNSANVSEYYLPNAQPWIIRDNQYIYSMDEISLEGASSYAYNGEMASYHWTQLSGASQVIFSNPDEADTTFIVPINSSLETYVLQLEVVDDTGAADTATLEFTVIPSVNCTSCTIDQIETLHDSATILGEQYGQVQAIDDAILAVANQASNKIEFYDLASANIQKEFQLSSAPDQLYFQSDRRLLYVSLVGATSIVQINVNSDEIQTFHISGFVKSMSGGTEQVFYALQNQYLESSLFSLGLDGNEKSHGSMNGDLVAYNASLNEIINAESDSSGGFLNRYGFNASGQLELIQTADPDSSGFFGPVPYAKNISLSSNDQQMAIAASYDGNGPQIPIMDFSPGNIQASSGAWLTDEPVAWVEFSASDKYLITVHDSFEWDASVVTVYDSTSKVRLFEKKIRSCRNQRTNPIQTGFSKDNLYFYTKIDCESNGAIESKSLINYTKLPEF